MAGDVTPYLEIDKFSGMFPRLLNDAESTLATDLLLPAAAIAIRNAFTRAGQEPPGVDDPMAKLVTFDLVKAALAVPAEYMGFTAYQHTSDDRIESGTLAAAAGLLDFTEQHRVVLGLSAAAAPQEGGMDGDFGDPFRAPYNPLANTGGPGYGLVYVGERPQ